MSVPDFFLKLKKEYVQKLKQYIDEIRENLSSNQFSSITDRFHKLKGSGKTYGMVEVSEIGAVMEEICRKIPSKEKQKSSVLLSLELLEKLQKYQANLMQRQNLENPPSSKFPPLMKNKKFIQLVDLLNESKEKG